MIITPLESTLPSLASEASAGGVTPSRSPGLHLSDIYRDIERTIKPKDEWATEEQLSAYGEVGFLWERVFSAAYRDAVVDGLAGEGNIIGHPTDDAPSEVLTYRPPVCDYIRPGEFVLDNIIMSPDLIRVSDWTLIETKATWRSVNKWQSLEKWFWVWLIQCQGYCKGIGTNRAEIHALFMCGDYKPPMPCKRAVRLEWTDRELDDNWLLIRTHAERRGWL